MHGRQATGKGKSVDAEPVCVHKWVPNNIKRLGAVLERFDGGCDILYAPDHQWNDLNAERARRRLNLGHLRHATGIACIGHDGQPTESWERLAQKCEAFATKIAAEI